ncbi:immunoglobulin superfamily member 11 isoform X4 [Centroberyx affinis]|uniref:immunoglobulin superfamily member 11 isoform X4 n=1 Tax=Centroberyx affinis TaxID=166261 RepID=UPI003A5C2E99
MVIPLSNANQPEQVIIYQGGQVFSLANHLNGRVGFVATMPSTSASIFINNTQLSDTGTYQCLVNNLPDRGGRNIGVIGLTVLVPPSVPACRIQGTLDVGSDIMLMCSSDEGIPTPSYSWEKLDALPKLPHNAMQDQMQGTVTLRNISTSTSGLFFYWRNKNKYDEEEIPNEIREDDLPPKRSSSVKAFHADASSSENDTLTSTNTYNSRYWHNPKPNYDTNSYTRYNGDTRQTFSAPAAPATSTFANGSHTLPPPKTLVVTTNSAPSPPTMVRSNGSVSLKPVPASTHGQHTHSYAVSQATLERMGAVPVMVPAQSRAGSLV